MELIKINDKKLKVMLTDLDMKCYNLSPNNIDYDCDATKSAFRRILQDARAQVGFDTEDERIFVQIYPGVRGGCEMYVTRLDGDAPEPHTLRTVYSFDSFEAMVTACRLLCRHGFRDHSALYRTEGRYHLLISEDYKQNNGTYSVGGRGRTLPAYPVLDEYGRRTVSEKYVAFLREHAHPLCPRDAVNMLGGL
ncbi:MAG: adaptor protein MecA [Clostridia bacterium]|nr:adaptor protein MecA [Clostridia bacterium]